MMTTIKSEASAQDWVRKLHYEDKVDSTLQAAVENSESAKIQVDEVPTASYTTSTTATSSSDSYLQSILSSPSQTAACSSSTSCTGSQTCVCYKCQRQRRRAGVSRTATAAAAAAAATATAVMKSSKTSPDASTPLKKNENVNRLSNRPTEARSSSSFSCSSPASPSNNNTAMISVTTPVSAVQSPTSPASPQQQQQQIQKLKRANTLRKTPTLKSYEKHLPRPAYAQQDSIYRFEQDGSVEQQKKEVATRKRSSSTSELLEKTAHDNYQISWKDEGTGDDLLTSLVTFQTIFEEKAGNENEGLSDLLEQRTKELKTQSILQMQQPVKQDEKLPQRLSECLTLSYRNGPRHNPLTLYHTMKMQGEKERLQAYSVAFQHCIHADSGMREWIKKPRTAPTRENCKLVQPAAVGRRPTLKRSLLHPLASRKNKVAGDELLIYSASSENLSARSAKSIEMISSPMPLVQQQQQQQSDQQITDIISATHMLLPNRQFSANTTTQPNKVPYEHIDTPSRPRQNATMTTIPPSLSQSELRDNSSVSSSESANGGPPVSAKPKKNRPGRLFSSIGRKTSMRSHSSNSNRTLSIRSLEKIDSGNESTVSQEKIALDDLCRVLPHIERSQLLPYVQEAHGDYMKALQLCKSALISGKLS